mgnify:CR=1 FL=1
MSVVQNWKGEDDKGKWIKVYIEPNFRSLTNFKKVKEGWNNYFYYRDSKRTKAKLSPDVEKSVSSVMKFHDKYFYKVQNLSLRDPIFDYYKKKKDYIDPSIINFARGVLPRLRKQEHKVPSFKFERKKVELVFD